MSLKQLYCCGPCILLDAFPLDGEIDFFIYLAKIWFFEKTWSRHFFLFYFLRKKQNKKEKPYVWLLKKKKQVCKKLSLGPGLGYLLGRYGGEP